MYGRPCDSPAVKNNVVMMWYTAAKGNPLPRLGRAEEIAWPIAFLCSPGASFMCGSIIDVNGGSYLRS